MAKEYLKTTIEEYLTDIASRSAVPGGGSATALTAATAAGLNLMVMAYSKKNEVRDNEKLDALYAVQKKGFKKLLTLIDKDCEVFRALMDKLASKSSAEQEYINAAQVPMEICRESANCLRAVSYLIENGNKNLLTDVGCAAHMFKASFYSAKLNVEINLKHIKNDALCKNIRSEIKQIEEEINRICDNAYVFLAKT
ncbi:MAG: cyclodeaminase/cyclohydrolase family protein [Candidatus Omnitrophica bacterium]|nr:cyclodeaminase/cyclohydrolase family protein [Candidatus Omnitrophota bacterium]